MNKMQNITVGKPTDLSYVFRLIQQQDLLSCLCFDTVLEQRQVTKHPFIYGTAF